MNEILDEFSAFITVVSSIIAIAAVTICSILSAYISQRGAIKAKLSELLFQEMTSAYYDYLKSSGDFSDLHDINQITAYSNAFNRAFLFGSKKTQALLKEHKQSMIKVLMAKEKISTGALLDDLSLKCEDVQFKLVLSMRKDLKK